MDLQHNPLTPLYVIGGVVIIVVLIRALFGDRSQVDDQREVARRSANWRGTNGLAARQSEASSLRANRGLNYLLALVLVTVAFGGLVWRVFAK
jgi:hypothetical protein